MKKITLMILISGCIAFIGSFLPLSQAGDLYVSIEHLKGILYLLYILPVIIIGFTALHMNGKFEKLKHIIIPVSILGLLLSVLGVYAGIGNLKHFISFNNGGMGDFKIGSPNIAIGGIIMILSYISSLVLIFMKKEQSTNSNEIHTD